MAEVLHTVVTKPHVQENKPFTILHVSLSYRLFQTDMKMPNLSDYTRLTDDEQRTIYVSKDIVDIFPHHPMEFLEACENYTPKQSTNLSPSSAFVIDIHTRPMDPVSSAMPAYAIMFEENHIYCLLATKFVAKCMIPKPSQKTINTLTSCFSRCDTIKR